MPYTKGYRYKRVPGDNQAAIATKQIQNPAYAASITLSGLDCEKNIIDFQQLTGALTLSADVLNPFTKDTLILTFSANASNQTVTPGAGFIGAGPLAVLANKYANVEYIFDGNAQSWVEKSRFIQS